MRSVGIDIGRYSIKVVELTVAKGSYHFSGAKIYPLNQNVVDHEVDIMQTLKQIGTDFKLESARVVTGIPQNFVSMHKVFFPFKERQKILKSLAFEIEDELPFSIDKFIVDAKTIGQVDKTSEVLAIACPKDEIERTIETFNRSGVDPDILSPEFSALANTYQSKWHMSPADLSKEYDSQQDQEDRMVVHFGHERTFVGLIRGSKLYWGRAVLWGASHVADRIAKTFQVPLTEAMKMMPEKAFLLMTTAEANEEQKKMSATVAEALEPLIQSLRFTILMAKTDLDCDVRQIELCGGFSETKNLGPYLTQKLEQPCNLLNPLDLFDRNKVKSLLAHKQTCHIAFGLAIEGLKRPVNPAVNFRMEEFAKKNQSLEKVWDKWGYTLKLAAIAWAIYFIAGFARLWIAEDLDLMADDTFRSQAKKLAQIQNPTRSKVRKYIKEQNKNVELVKLYDQVDDIVSPMQILHDVSNLLPANDRTVKYDIRHFSVKADVVTIHGVTDDKTMVGKIKRALESMARDKKVQVVPPVIPDEEGRTKFSFRINIKRKK